MQRFASALVEFGGLLGQLFTQNLVLVFHDVSLEGFVVWVITQASEYLLCEVVEVVEVFGHGVYLLGRQVWAVWSGASGRFTGEVMVVIGSLQDSLCSHVSR